jgi:hypothetical protein
MAPGATPAPPSSPAPSPASLAPTTSGISASASYSCTAASPPRAFPEPIPTAHNDRHRLGLPARQPPGARPLARPAGGLRRSRSCPPGGLCRRPMAAPTGHGPSVPHRQLQPHAQPRPSRRLAAAPPRP